MPGASKDITFKLKIDGKEFEAKLEVAEDEVKSLRRAVKGVAGTMSEWGNVVTGFNQGIQLTKSIMRGINDFMQKYVQYEAGLKNVNTILRVGNEELIKIGNELLDISTEVGEGMNSLAEATYQAASAGYNQSDSLMIVAESAKAAKAGLTDTKIAVDATTTVLNAFHLEASKAQSVNDLLFKTVEKGKTTFPELAANIAQVAPIAAANNIKFEQITAAIATLTKQGVPTAQAITQIRQSIIAANEVLGDGWTSSMTYQEGMKAIADQAGGSQVKLKELVGRVEGMNAVLGVTGQNSKMAKADLQAMTDAAGAMGAAFAEQTDSIQFKTERLSASLDALSISLVENFANPISDMIDNFVGGLDVIFGKTELIGGAQFKPVEMTKLVAQQMENLKGTTKEWRDEYLKTVTQQWESLDVQIQSGELDDRALRNALLQLRTLEAQATAIDNLNKKKEKSADNNETESVLIPGLTDEELQRQKEYQVLLKHLQIGNIEDQRRRKIEALKYDRKLELDKIDAEVKDRELAEKLKYEILIKYQKMIQEASLLKGVKAEKNSNPFDQKEAVKENWNLFDELADSSTQKLRYSLYDVWDGVGAKANSVFEQMLVNLLTMITSKGLDKIFSEGSSGEEEGSIGGDIFDALWSMIPFLDTGAVVSKPTLAMIGEKNKKEAIIPLENETGKRALAMAFPGGGGSVDTSRMEKIIDQRLEKFVSALTAKQFRITGEDIQTVNDWSTHTKDKWAL